jgi:poly(3-hydroxyalkanoate) synthetase
MSAVAKETLYIIHCGGGTTTYTINMQMEQNVKSCEVLMADISVSCFIRTVCQFQR